MGVRYEVTACPLCRAEFDEPEDYRSHLADEHDLVDDEGTETVLHEAVPALPVLEAPPELDVLEPLPPPPPPPAESPASPAVAPPAPVSAAAVMRKAPAPFAVLAIAVAVQLLLGLVGVAVVGGDGTEEARSTVIVESSPATAAAPAASSPTPAAVSAAAPASGTASAPAPAASTADPAADQRRADAISPKLSDFPAGWTAEGSVDAFDSAGGEGFESCGVASSEADTSAMKMAGFSNDSNAVLSLVSIEKTKESAIKAMDDLRQSLPCVRDAAVSGVTEGLPEGISIHASEFEPIQLGRYADQSDARSMNVTFAGPGGQISMTIDVLSVRRDRAVLMLMVMSPGGGGLTNAQERAILASVVSRM